ncbi:MAG TPA: UDP-3-O-(3-hydroxymyristoyl)glucosamine N-acyltransferase [Verrucomicrobiae bacterium]|jgi:UDP-3-O-[3-hydroxymyristoyl] glucosamine N-acyltransferase|nr:UDP-3-O-(3-hydroxymyristoyl)glucosamine N-acyltransferase [Verrucomicrobiae bacterium]
MPFTAAEIAKRLQGEVLGDAAVVLNAFAPADRAQAGDLTFAENADYFARAEQSAASAIIVDGNFTSKKILIRVPNARIGFAKALELFFPEPVFAPGVHPTAIVAASAQVDPAAHVGPCCVVGEKARIGARSILQGGNHVGPHCHLGEDVNLFPNVTIYARSEIGNRVRIHAGTVIGSDGFGYVQDNGVHRKVPQIGNVIIRDDVEIGSNVCIDRGALGPTIIGKGTKIDNLVQIAHNVSVGEHCLVISQVGVAGSTKLGNYVILAGQVGLAGHLKIGNRVTVVAQAGVMNNIPDGEKWMGAPAQPDRQAKRQMIAMTHLPDLLRRVAELEKKLGMEEERE